MASNQESVKNYYHGGGEDGRARASRAISEEFYYTEKFIRPFITPSTRVLELGCGTGYYGFRFAGLCAEYVGIDLSPDNIAIFREKITASGIQNLRCECGDATDLAQIPSNSFDVILCLGPMYHLPREARARVFDECRRIAADDAVLAFAYINRLGVYAGACTRWGARYPNRETNRAVFEHSTDDDRPDLFFYTSPEEMQADAESHGFSDVCQYGLDFFFLGGAIDEMTEEQFACYRELADRMSESSSCVGLANHALLTCRKKVSGAHD